MNLYPLATIEGQMKFAQEQLPEAENACRRVVMAVSTLCDGLKIRMKISITFEPKDKQEELKGEGR